VTDWNSGLDASKDGALLSPPDGNPRYGENHAFWIHDEATGIQINGHLNTAEDLGDFGQRLGKLSVTFPNGRLLQLRTTGAGTEANGPSNGNMHFRCVEPFRKWTCRFAGGMADASVPCSYISTTPLEMPRVAVRFDVETEMVAPAWIQGGLVEGGLGAVTAFIGGERYEQLFRAKGTLVVEGQSIPISGFGNRTHRYGVRDLAATAAAPRMLGHVWAAAAFPSGAGFGLQIYPTADGGILWGEGLFVRDGKLIRAEILEVPWLKSYHQQDEDMLIRLRADDGEVFEVTGKSISSVITLMVPAPQRGEQLPLSQSAVRYSYKGEQAINMMERSLRRSSIETGVGRP
jgi:hypothetical protein